jgi:four helix bundle protein
MKENNQIAIDSKNFAIRIVRLYNYLNDVKKEFVMSKQILRSGTSVGANISESVFAQSRQDFISKLSISLKEASETKFWLEILHETDFINDVQFDSLYEDNSKLIGTLVNIINSTKNNNNV